MEKTDLLERLATFKTRLTSDVVSAYESRGSEFGRERFAAWRRQLSMFLDENLPGQCARLNAMLHHTVMFANNHESDLDIFMRMDGIPCLAFIDSLSIDVQNDEFDFTPPEIEKVSLQRGTVKPSNRVFIVHGHDQLLLTKAARFVEKLGLEPIILHEQASKGMTIIEKIEDNTDVGFAIILYTPDDKGNKAVEADAGNLQFRARQNVIFEHGYLVAKLKRSHVVPLMAGSIEIPSDISGVVYVEDSNWQVGIAREMLAAGYDIDFNRLLRS